MAGPDIGSCTALRVGEVGRVSTESDPFRYDLQMVVQLLSDILVELRRKNDTSKEPEPDGITSQVRRQTSKEMRDELQVIMVRNTPIVVKLCTGGRTPYHNEHATCVYCSIDTARRLTNLLK